MMTGATDGPLSEEKRKGNECWSGWWFSSGVHQGSRRVISICSQKVHEQKEMERNPKENTNRPSNPPCLRHAPQPKLSGLSFAS